MLSTEAASSSVDCSPDEDEIELHVRSDHRKDADRFVQRQCDLVAHMQTSILGDA